MLTPELAAQKALFEALSGLGLSVHDVAPQRPDDGGFPHVTVGAIVFAPWDTKDGKGHDFVARVHTRSRSSSMAEAKAIQGRIYDRLHDGELTIEGQTLILLQRQLSDVTRLADGSFHGVCEYHGLIETT